MGRKPLNPTISPSPIKGKGIIFCQPCQVGERAEG